MYTKNNNFFSVEGNIGAGKSTFLNKISQALHCPLLLEPCDEWQNINEENLLNEFYKDTKRWAYSFQLYAFLTRIEAIEKKIEINNCNFFIAERSIFADRYVFAKACYEAGNMSSLEWNMYKKWFDWTLNRKKNSLLPSGIIYLQVDPEVSYQRIQMRGRKEEKEISFDYLQSLNNYHNKWLIEKNNIHEYIKKIPILIINCNQDFEYDENMWNNIVYKVKNFLKINYNDLLLSGEIYGNSTSNKCSYQ